MLFDASKCTVNGAWPASTSADSEAVNAGEIRGATDTATGVDGTTGDGGVTAAAAAGDGGVTAAGGVAEKVELDADGELVATVVGGLVEPTEIGEVETAAALAAKFTVSVGAFEPTSASPPHAASARGKSIMSIAGTGLNWQMNLFAANFWIRMWSRKADQARSVDILSWFR